MDKNAMRAGRIPVRPADQCLVGTQVLCRRPARFGAAVALPYNGFALSDPQARYANKVLAMKRRLLTAAGRDLPSATDA